MISYFDITDRKRFEAELSNKALRDSLTGLPNRALLVDRINQILHDISRRQGSAAVVAADIDHFKVVNDSLGHASGDELLVALSGRLTAISRVGDTIARIGGDSLVFVFPGVGTVEALEALLGRITDALAAPFEVSGREIFVSLGMGITFATPQTTADILITEAETAMYQAKSRGAGQRSVFEETLRGQALAQLDLDAALRRALARDELTLHYQPVVLLDDHSVVGTEALVRWARPDHGMIAPDQFIGLAEQTGLIVPLGEHVLQGACRQLAEWSKDPTRAEWTMSVNLSAVQFRHPDVVRMVQTVLDDTHIRPDRLVLEITESVLMRNRSTFKTAHALRELGVRLSVDDFGTGYSSLAYLKHLPLFELKIDRSFTSGVTEREDDQAIVRAIVSIADALGLEVVVEGVETPDQAAQVRAMGCQRAQGYLFGKPVPPTLVGAEGA